MVSYFLHLPRLYLNISESVRHLLDIISDLFNQGLLYIYLYIYSFSFQCCVVVPFVRCRHFLNTVSMYMWVSMCVSTNVKISHSEPMSQIFRHIVISTHKNVEMCRAETMCTFSLRKKFVKKCDIQTDTQTHRRTDNPF